MSDKKYHLDNYGDNEVQEYHDTPIPKFLLAVYMILPIWGVMWWALYWNGSQGFLDRGYWSDLEEVAGTKKVAEKLVEPRHTPMKKGEADASYRSPSSSERSL